MRAWIRSFTIAVLWAAAVFTCAAEERRFAPAEVKAEFQELYARLKASHFNLFVRRPQPEYDALHRSMMASFDRPMTLTEMRVQFQKFMAFGRVAHSRIEFPSDAYGAYRDGGGKIMPFTLRVVAGRAYVSRSGTPALVEGDEVLGLNGTPTAAWLERLGAHVSADNPYMLHTLLENRLPALLWLELGAVDQVTVRAKRRSGISDVIVPARTREEIKAATASRTGVLALDWDARIFKILDNGVGYLRPGPFYNNDSNATDIWDVTAFRKFIDASFTTLVEGKTRTLVIDLRDNPGGDNSFSDLMVGWFATKPFRFTSRFDIKVSEAAIASNAKRVTPNDPDAISNKFAAAYAKARPGDVITFDIPFVQPRAGIRFTGRVYLLINRHSYSNTVLVAALAQDYKFATILGEETSDLATTYGAMEHFTLPRMGIEVGFPKAHIIRPSGDTSARGVIPDIAIATPLVERTDDPVLLRAIAIASAGR
jgi:C-terminal processing protease CtpA/Prc